MKINCPLCGPRPNGEFTIKGDALNVRPEFESSTGKDWHDYVYLRDNPKGNLKEFWHHSHGCRSWLVVERNNVTHEVLSMQLASEASDEGAKK